jgi:serine/threonine-protein kinase
VAPQTQTTPASTVAPVPAPPVDDTTPAIVAPVTFPPATARPTLPPPPRTDPPAPVEVPGDLHLSIPMMQPACDGQFITIVASAVTPGQYATQVAIVLDQRPGASYLRTDQTCPSLRPDVDGNPIYIVYFGPFATKSEACDARALGPTDAYVKVLDTTTSYTTPHVCN